MLAEIEDAMISAIKGATALQYLKSCESYAGQLDDDLGNVIRAFPAVWVTFGGSGKPVRHGANLWKFPCTFAVMHGARNIRNEKAARQGTPGEVGTYQMLEHTRTLLLNQDLGLQIAELQPGPVKVIYNTKTRAGGLSVLAQEWHTAYVGKVPTPDEVDLLRVGINYFLTPGDDVADASDDIEFTQENP
jgi:phage gp37-like protein